MVMAIAGLHSLRPVYKLSAIQLLYDLSRSPAIVCELTNFKPAIGNDDTVESHPSILPQQQSIERGRQDRCSRCPI